MGHVGKYIKITEEFSTYDAYFRLLKNWCPGGEKAICSN